MKDSTQKILVIVGIFVLLNAMLALKYYQTQRQAAGLGDESIIGQGTPVLLELGSHSCIPCKEMMPILDALSKEQTAFRVSFIDVWQDREKGKAYNIEAIPVQIFFDGQGKELYRHVGFYPKENILSKWNELGVDVLQ